MRRGDDFADQIQAADFRHDVVDDEEIERPLGKQPLCVCARARCLDHLVPGLAQRPAERLEDFLFVVDEEDGTVLRRHASGRSCGIRRRGGGEVDTNLGAAADDARHADDAAQTFDNVLGDRQAEAGAAALRGEVRIEDAREIVRDDPDAAVGNGDDDAPASGGRLQGDWRIGSGLMPQTR